MEKIKLKVIIAGGRGFDNYELLKVKCDLIMCEPSNFDYEIISGTARGADELGERYAVERGYEVRRFPADWDKYGKSAGYKRNEQMAEYANAVIVFWDGISRGTKHMIDIAKENDLPLRIIRY